ncbi:MAG: flagellar filament capping protein FliD, partial [Zwartia sp.]
NNSAVSATVTTGAMVADYGLEVSQLAQSQSAASTVFATGATVGTGTLTIELGSWNTGMTSFTAASGGTPVTVSIGSSDSSLASIAAKINDADAGVVASVLKDVTGERLVVRSKTSGEVNAFRIQVADDDSTQQDNTGLSALAFDPAAGTPAGTSSFGMPRTLEAKNALAKINGVDVVASTNKLSDSVTNVTFNLSQITSSAVTVSVGQDVDGIRNNIKSFVTAYNTLNAMLSGATKYDETKKQAGTFQADSSMLGLLNMMRNIVGSSSTGSATYSRLSDIGLEVQKGGSLADGGAKLETALLNMTELKKMFTTETGNETTRGIGLKLKNFTNGVLAATRALTNRNAAFDAAVRRNTVEQEKVTARATVFEARLRTQYAALDANLGRLSALNSYVSQQVTSWNKSTGN